MKHAICDKCGETIKIKLKKRLQKDGLEGQVTINYFSCSKCKSKYTTSVENDEFRKLTKERRKIYSEIRSLDDLDEIDAAIKKVEELDKKIKLLHGRLKLKFKA